MQGPERPAPRIRWMGVNAAGYLEGWFDDGAKGGQIDIAIPGRGDPAHQGPLHHVFIAREKVGSMPNLKSAQALAELHLLQAALRQSSERRFARKT